VVSTGPALRIWPGARNTRTRRGARGEELSGERISTVGPALCVASRSRAGLAAGNHIDRRALVQRLPHAQEQVELDARPVLVELRGQADLDHGGDVLRRALAPAQELDELVGKPRLAQLEPCRHPPSLSEESRFLPPWPQWGFAALPSLCGSAARCQLPPVIVAPCRIWGGGCRRRVETSSPPSSSREARSSPSSRASGRRRTSPSWTSSAPGWGTTPAARCCTLAGNTSFPASSTRICTWSPRSFSWTSSRGSSFPSGRRLSWPTRTRSPTSSARTASTGSPTSAPASRWTSSSWPPPACPPPG